MSLLWRKPFGNVWLMLKSLGKHLAQFCGCCPCTDWHIATVCPCDQCQQPGKCFVGDAVEGVEGLIDGETYELVALTMTDHVPVDANNNPDGDLNGNVSQEPWACVPTYKGCTLWAIKHETKVAPSWPGYMNVAVYVDRVPVKEWHGTPYTPSETMFIGDGVDAQSGGDNVLEVLYDFTEERDYVLDVRVSFAADGSEPTVVYTLRNIIRVGAVGNDAWLGDVFVVPGWLMEVSSDECATGTAAAPGYAGIVGLTLEAVRGPFRTREHAEYVLDNWRDLIEAYAITCVCNADVDDDVELLYFDGSVDPPDENGWCRLNRFGTGGDYTAIILSQNTWVQYDSYLTGGDSYDTQARLYDEFGNYTLASQSGGYVPPCSELSFWIKPKVSEPNTNDVVLGGEFWVVGTGVECVLTDPESEFYGVQWDYYDCAGVPNNSVELEDYLENCAV